MLQILKIEWLKLRKYRAFMVLSILVVVGIFGANYIVYSAFDAMNVAVGISDKTTAIGNAVIGTPFGFPDVFATVSYVSSYMLILLGLIMLLLMGNEHAFRTNRQNVIDGLGRGQFIAGKMLIATLMGVAVTVIVFIVACLFGASGEGAFSLSGIRYMGYFFVQSLSYMAVAMVIAMIVKRSGVAIGIYFVYAMVAEGFLSLIIRSRTSSIAAYLLPLESADKLIPPPTMMGKMLTRGVPDPMWLLTAALAWIAVCVWFCSRKFGKSDL